MGVGSNARTAALRCGLWTCWYAMSTSAPRLDATELVVLPQPSVCRRVCFARPKKPSRSFVVAEIRGSSKQTNRCSPYRSARAVRSSMNSAVAIPSPMRGESSASRLRCAPKRSRASSALDGLFSRSGELESSWATPRKISVWRLARPAACASCHVGSRAAARAARMGQAVWPGVGVFFWLG
jgi:hypothetical protein